MFDKKIGSIQDIASKYGGVLLDINTPIIGIFGSGEESNKYNTQISIRKAFISLGYSFLIIKYSSVIMETMIQEYIHVTAKNFQIRYVQIRNR